MTESNLTESSVADWLERHPEFLSRHPRLLAQMEIPHESGTASLIERQVQILRDDNAGLQRRLRHLSGVAGENERLMRRLHSLSLRLVSAPSAEALFELLDSGLREEFRADAVRIQVEKARRTGSELDSVGVLSADRPDWLVEFLEGGKTLCGRLTRDKREVVFGDDADSISSSALIPIDGGALLAIGSESDERFHPDMGTLFLDLLGETLRFRLALDRDAAKPRRQRA